MQLRRAVFGFLVAVCGGAGLISACATTVELSDEDEDGLLSDGGGSGGTSRDGAATPPKGSSSGGSSGRSSSSGSNGTSSGGGGGGSSSSGSSSGGSSGSQPSGPNPGTPCDVPSRVYTRSCGMCGTETARCLTGDAGTLVVGQYGGCTGEEVGGCYPTDPPQTGIACGYCGTQTRTCNNSCKWVTSSCTGEVTVAEKCMPGATRLSNDTCDDKTKFATWECNDATAGNLRCLWDIPAPNVGCEATSFASLTVPAGTGTASREVTVAEQTKRVRPMHTACNSSVVQNSWGAITEIRNTGASAVTVSVSITPRSPSNTGELDRMLAIYTTPPLTDDVTKACQAVNDRCSTAPLDTDSEACLTSITIPAGGTRYALSADFAQTTAKAYTIRVRRQ